MRAGALALGPDDACEDIVTSVGEQFHIMRPIMGCPTLFFYMVLDRRRTNLAMSRIMLADVERALTVSHGGQDAKADPPVLVDHLAQAG